MKTLRVTVQLFALLCGLSLYAGVASASTLTLSGSLSFSSLDGSAQDSDGVVNEIFTVSGDLVIDGTIRCNDDAPLSPGDNACPIRISVTGNLTMEPGSEIFAENRRGNGNGGDVRLDVGGDLTLHGPEGSLPGALISTSQILGTVGNAGSITAVAAGSIDFEAGSVLAANSQGRNAGSISVTGDTVRVAGLVAAGPSRTVLPSRLTDAALAGGGVGQAGGTIDLHALGSADPGLRIEPEAIVVSQGSGGGGRLVFLEACGIEVRGLVASLSRNNGPSQVVLRSGKGILIDGRDLGSAAPVEGRFGRVRADGTQQGAAGYLVNLFAESDIQALGPDPEDTDLFAVSSTPGELPLRNAGGTITALSLSGALTALGNAFETGRDVVGDKGGLVDLQARNDVTLDDAVVRSVGGYTVLTNAGVGGQIAVRSFQGAVSWTFGRGDVRPTGSFVFPARRGTIEITACSTVDTIGSQFPVNGSAVLPFPVETEGVCAPAAPSLPEGESPLPVCAIANQPPAPSGGPFSVAEDSANGTVVGTVSANDPNPGQSHIFSILAGNTGGAFAINSSGVITVANSAALDFETNPTFNLTVEVTDDGTPPLSGTANVIINLTNKPEAPVATDEGTPASPYVETVGNTILEVTAAPALNGAKVSFNGNVLTNDSDPDGPTAFTVTLESATPGAVVSLHPDGTFTYLPPPGFTGVDSFTYRITDPDGLSDTATVYVNVEHRVWYVRNDAPADGLGRSTEPFDTLAEVESASSPGDTVYLFEGSGTTTGQSDGITLKSGQRLIGEAVQLTIPETVNINGVNGPTLRSATGNKPRIENDDTPDAPGEDNGVSVPAIAGDALGVEIRGLDISGFDNAIDVTATGAHNAGVTIRDNVVSNATSEGIDVNAGSTGTMTLAIQDNILTATGTALDIQKTAGTAYVTSFHDNVVTAASAGAGIVVMGSGGVVTFDAVPGGPIQPVPGGTTTIGTPGDRISGPGLVLSNVTGALSFANLAAGTIGVGDLDIFSDSGAAFSVSGGAGGFHLDVTPNAGVLVANAGPAAVVSVADVDLQLNSLSSSNSAASGISLTSVSGTFSAPSGSSITNAGTTDFVIDSTSAAVTYGGTITDDVGQLVSVSNSGGSNKLFTGAITDGDDGDGGGISLTGNSSTVRFSGGMILSTGSNLAFTATGGGTVEVCDENPCNPGAAGLMENKITTTTGMALNVANTTIGLNNLEFRSISAGTVTGSSGVAISLDNTGTAAANGGLVVRGTGTAGSGGTIQHKTGADGSTTAGLGIYLNGTRAASFNRMQLNDFDNFAIRANEIVGLTLSDVVVSGLNGNSAAADEGSIFLEDAGGTIAVSSTNVSGGFEDNLRVLYDNATAGPAAVFNVTGSTFRDLQAAGNNSLVNLRSATTAAAGWDVDFNFTGPCVFENDARTLPPGGTENFADALLVTFEGPFQHSLNVQNATFHHLFQAMDIASNFSADVAYTLKDNTITFTEGAAAIALGSGALSTNQSFLTGLIQGNNIGTSGVAQSGSKLGLGIALDMRGEETAQFTLHANVIRRTEVSGIQVIGQTAADGNLDIQITNNDIAEIEDNGGGGAGVIYGIEITTGAGTSHDICLDARNNDSFSVNAQDIRVRQSNAAVTFAIEGLTGSGTSDVNVESYLMSQNPGSTADVRTGGSIVNYTSVANCTTPSTL